MPRSKRWVCDQVKLKYHEIKDKDFKNLLAELWEVLLPSLSQINLCPQKIAIDSSKDRLSKLRKRARR